MVFTILTDSKFIIHLEFDRANQVTERCEYMSIVEREFCCIPIRQSDMLMFAVFGKYHPALPPSLRSTLLIIYRTWHAKLSQLQCKHRRAGIPSKANLDPVNDGEVTNNISFLRLC
ncbi:unnamed protein product [Penicillium bialowiezense]